MRRNILEFGRGADAQGRLEWPRREVVDGWPAEGWMSLWALMAMSWGRIVVRTGDFDVVVLLPNGREKATEDKAEPAGGGQHRVECWRACS